MGYFWDKNQICDTPTWQDHELRKDVLNDLNNAWVQTRPICLEKKRMIAIRPRGLKWGKPLKGLEYIFKLRGSN